MFQKGLEHLRKIWMNFQMYRKPPHCLCCLLKCFQRKRTFVPHRGSENMFNTDKRLLFFFLFCKHWVMERENHLPQICARARPAQGLWLQSSVLCFSHETLPFPDTYEKTAMCLLSKSSQPRANTWGKRIGNTHKQCFLFSVAILGTLEKLRIDLKMQVGGYFY